MISRFQFRMQTLSARTALFILLVGLPLSLFACADAHEVGMEATGTDAPLASNPGEATRSGDAIARIEPSELAARLQSPASAPLVLDVRTKTEFDAGHIPGALHIPHDELANRLAEIDATNGVAVHCMVGPRARKAEATLASSGVENILHLEGGYLAWKKAGFDTTE